MQHPTPLVAMPFVSPQSQLTPGHAPDIYSFQPSTVSSLSHVHTIPAAPPSLSQGELLLNMLWANPEGIFDFNDQRMDTVGIQDHAEVEDGNEGYSDRNRDGDTTLQPYYSSSSYLDGDVVPNLHLPEQSQCHSQHSASETIQGQYTQQAYDTSVNVPPDG